LYHFLLKAKGDMPVHQAKINHFLFLVIALLLVNMRYTHPSPPSLGKTHFILGCPAPQTGICTEEMPPIERMTVSTAYSGTLLRTKDGRVCTALFAPDDKWYITLLSLIEHEQEAIRIAVYLLTDGRLAEALCAAHARGVVVEIVTDPSCANDKSNKLGMLCQAGIHVYVYTPADRGIMANLMHNKFALFAHSLYDRPIVWTGSANVTRSAEFHQENILIVDDADVCAQYQRQFDILKKRAETYRPPSAHKKRVTQK
jgi:cardiolipin hydrolase